MSHRRPTQRAVVCAAVFAVFGAVGMSSAARSQEAKAEDRNPSAPGGVTHGNGLTVEDLMASLQTTSGVRANFLEEKHIALLSEPLQSRGVLYFAPPDRLARHTVSPWPARLVIAEGEILMQDATGENRVDIASSEAARGFVDSFIVLFNGDLEGLRQNYDVEYASAPEGWVMKLAPRGLRVARLIREVHLRGRGVALEQMDIIETQGDRTTTRFVDVETQYPFTPDELDGLFDLAPIAPPAGTEADPP